MCELDHAVKLQVINLSAVFPTILASRTRTIFESSQHKINRDNKRNHEYSHGTDSFVCWTSLCDEYINMTKKIHGSMTHSPFKIKPSVFGGMEIGTASIDSYRLESHLAPLNK